MVIRGAPAIGVAAAMGIALGMTRSSATGHQAVHDRVSEDLRPDGGDATDGGESVLGHRAHEADVCRSRAGWQPRWTRSSSGSKPRRATIHDEDVASCRAMGAHGATLVPDDGAHPHALQRRRAGDRRLRHGARRDSRGGGAGQEDRGARRRDAAVSAGRAADRVGAGQGRHRHDGHHRQHGRRR